MKQPTAAPEKTREPAPSVTVRFLQRAVGVTDRAAHLRAGMSTTPDRLADAAGSYLAAKA